MKIVMHAWSMMMVVVIMIDNICSFQYFVCISTDNEHLQTMIHHHLAIKGQGGLREVSYTYRSGVVLPYEVFCISTFVIVVFKSFVVC